MRKGNPQKSDMIFPTYTDRNPGDVWEWILRVRDNSRRNIKLDQEDFIDMDPLSRESGFSIAAWGERKGFNSLFGFLAKTSTKWWPTVDEFEMPELPCFTAEEGIQRLRVIVVLERVCHLRSSHLPLLTKRKDTPLSQLWEVNLWGESQHPWRALWLLFLVGQKLQWKLLSLNWET